MFGMITFANGTLGQWVDHYAGHGEPFAHRMVFGTRGSIAAPGDRNGRPVRLMRSTTAPTSVTSASSTTPPATGSTAVGATLFGGERPWTYDFDFPTTDRKIIALEYAEFAACVRDRHGSRKSTASLAPRASPSSTPSSSRSSPAAR